MVVGTPKVNTRLSGILHTGLPPHVWWTLPTRPVDVRVSVKGSKGLRVRVHTVSGLRNSKIPGKLLSK